MQLLTSAKTTPSLAGRLKLAQLLEFSEKEFEGGIRELELNPLFGRLRHLGVLIIEPYSNARFAARRFAGHDLRVSSSSNVDLIDGRGDIVRLIESVGQKNFENYFLGEDLHSDEERASQCEISTEQVRVLRAFVDQLYVQSEFESAAPQTATERTFSAVAAVEIAQERPILGFFNREIWKGRYRIQESKKIEFLGSLSCREAKRAASFLRELEFVDLRKSTLYRILEILVETQSEYFLSRNPADRRSLTQESVATRLNISPSVVNRLISNKSIQLPWGLEAPMKILFPSSKALMRDRLYDLAIANPLCRDKELCQLMIRLHGACLSRQSITQYRKELGLLSGGQRTMALAHRGGVTSQTSQMV